MNGADIGQSLETEIDRIVSSPYPTQLKTLQEICDKASDLQIEGWVLSNSSKVRSLVFDVLDGLPRWKYVVNIITKLATCKQIRDEILQQQPTILSGYVGVAISQGATPNDIRTAVVLLKHPLPESIAVPAAAQDLLCRLFQQAAAAPKSDILGAVYSLLAGACRPLPRILSSDVLRQFEQYVFGILREATDVDNPMILLYCLAIMRILVESFSEVHHTSSQRLMSSSPTSQTWRPDAMRSFFDGVKAHKALQLIVLRVVWACKAGMSGSTEAYECIRFANIILAGIREEIKTEWCINNPAIERKALTFANALSSRNAASVPLFAQFQQYLISPGDISIALYDFDECLGWTYTTLESGLDESTCIKIIHSVLAQALGQQETSVVHQHMSRAILDRLSEATTLSSSIRQAVLRAATEEPEARMLRRLLAVSNEQPTESPVHDSKTPRLLLSKICCSLFLRAGLAAGPDDIRLPSDLVSTLLQSHAHRDDECTQQHNNNQRQPVRVLASAVETYQEADDESLGSNDWRTYLDSVFTRNRDQQAKSVMSAVATICQTLENRCNDVEGPLRQEREERTQLQDKHDELVSKYSELEQACGTLEAQLVDRDLRISSLEKENEQSAAAVEESRTENSDLLYRIEEAEARLQEANESMRIKLDSLNQQRQESEMEKAITLASKQDALESLRGDLRHVQQSMQQTEASLQQERHNYEQSRTEIERLNARGQQLSVQLEEMNRKLEATNNELTAAQEQAGGLRQDVQQHQRSASAAQSEIETLRQRIEQVQIEGRQEIDRRSKEFENRLAEERSQWQSEQAKFETELDQVRQEQAEAQDAFEADQEATAQKIQDQRRKIERLAKELSKKDAQIAEAQEMRNRLMNAMGLNLGAAQSPPKHSSLPYRSASSADTPRTQPPTTPARGTSPTQGDESLASAILSQNGSTPKRSKPRAFKVPSLQQPRASMGLRSAKSALRNGSAMKRQPMMDISTNRSPLRAGRSPSKVAFKTIVHEKEMSTDNRNALAEWSFSTDVLTSTPGLGLKRVEGFEDLDESTADVV
ncbi:hypothetical protein MBLNU457_g2586t2 [Dothideomycetes sp. NU457]